MADPSLPEPTGQVSEPQSQQSRSLFDLASGLISAVSPAGLEALKNQVVAAVDGVTREAQAKTEVVKEAAKSVGDALPPPVRAAAQGTVDFFAKAVDASMAQDSPLDQAAATPRASAGDPVDLATGHLVYRHTDLALDGGGIRCELVRTYRSGGKYPLGPLGQGWDHNYNLWLREESPDSLVLGSGEFREDRYERVTPRGGAPDPRDYYAMRSGYHSTITRVGSSFTLTRPDGATFEYAQLTTPGLHKLRRSADRFSNELVFQYDANERLERIVVNDERPVVTRFLQFHYDSLGRIDRVGDSTGRVVVYTYDELDDLVAVTLTPTHGAPLGRSTYYEYSSTTGPVAHQLRSVVDEDGRRYLDVEFAAGDGYVDADRVIRQRDESGEWSFSYALLEVPDPAGSTHAPDVPTRYALMARPGGHQIEHWLNEAGAVLVKTESALDENGQLVSRTWRTRYNADGQITAQVTPEGRVIQQEYGREAFLRARGRGPHDDVTEDIAPAAGERRAFGNVLAILKRSAAVTPSGLFPVLDDLRVVHPVDIVMVFTYEPEFQQLASRNDPRDPTNAALATKYLYDDRGALAQIVRPAVTLPDGTLLAPAGEQRFYDAKGRLTRTVDPSGHTTLYEYFGTGETRPPDPLPGTELPVALVPAITIAGHLRSVTTAAGEAGEEATTTFDVNARGVRIRAIDARGSETRWTIDAQDLPTRVSRVLARSGGAEVELATTYLYTHEGKVRRRERPVVDDTGATLGPTQTAFYRYGETGLLLRESLGAADARTWLSTRHVYDGEGRRTRTIQPTGRTVRLKYDVQGRVTATTRGFGSPEAATSRATYSLDGLLRATLDARGNATIHSYDDLGRLIRSVQVVDVPVETRDARPLQLRQGHTRMFTRDALDNIVLERFFEWLAPDRYNLLARTSTHYDERGRKIRVVDDWFDGPIPCALGDFAASSPPSSTAVESWFFYDDKDLLVEQRDGVVIAGPRQSAGSCVRFAYDALGRRTSERVCVLELGPNAIISETHTTFDRSGNPVRVDRHQHELDATGTRLRTEVISSAREYDSLDRVTATIDGLGNRTELRYSSLDLLVERRDPRGNVTRYDYDVYGRVVRRTEKIDATEQIEVRYGYDGDGLRTSLARGNPTEPRTFRTIDHAYDALTRRIATILARGTALERVTQVRYDAAANVIEKIAPNGLRTVQRFDQLNRRVRVTFDRAAVTQPVAGSTFEAWEYDAAGRVTSARNDSGAVTTSYDSLGRATTETQTVGSEAFTITRAFDSLGSRSELGYPSGRIIHAAIDSAGRVHGLDDSTLGSRVLERSFVGSFAYSERLGNGAAITYRRDAAGRNLGARHASSTGTLLYDIAHVHDAASNRRAEWWTEAAGRVRTWVYAYDGVNWLRAATAAAANAPALGAFAPPSTARISLGGQAALDGLIPTPGGTPDPDDESYAYDSGGNVRGIVLGGVPSGDDTDSLDRRVSSRYDDNGNRLAASNHTAIYDERDRIVGTTDAVFTAVYDCFGRRVARTENGATVRSVYDGAAEIAEYRDGVLAEEYVTLGADRRIVESSGAGARYLHVDVVCSTRLVTDDTGTAAVTILDYGPYGRLLRARGDAAAAKLRFMGRRLDELLGAYDFRARHYDPQICGFAQRDPADAVVERSAYQAFAGNPLRFVDPTGTVPSHTGDTGELDESDESPWPKVAEAFANVWHVAGEGLEQAGALEHLGKVVARSLLEAAWKAALNPDPLEGIAAVVEDTGQLTTAAGKLLHVTEVFGEHVLPVAEKAGKFLSKAAPVVAGLASAYSTYKESKQSSRGAKLVEATLTGLTIGGITAAAPVVGVIDAAKDLGLRAFDRDSTADSLSLAKHVSFLIGANVAAATGDSEAISSYTSAADHHGAPYLIQSLIDATDGL